MRRLLMVFWTGLGFTGMAYGEEHKPAWHAADDYYDPAEMAAARMAVRHHHGGMSIFFVQADRLEYRWDDGESLLLWDAQGWYGGPVEKFWVKTEGEYLFESGAFGEAEVQALYSRAISPYFDLQAGLRYDAAPNPTRTYAVIGVQGLVPQWFEVDAAAFVSHEGDVSARLELEYELLLTQRLVLQPRTELEFAVQEVEELGIGSGLSTAEVGLRLRYEVLREIAPYIGVSWHWKVGGTANFARAGGDETEGMSVVAGLRLWY
jgi:copper resistance protein B